MTIRADRISTVNTYVVYRRPPFEASPTRRFAKRCDTSAVVVAIIDNIRYLSNCVVTYNTFRSCQTRGHQLIHINKKFNERTRVTLNFIWQKLNFGWIIVDSVDINFTENSWVGVAKFAQFRL